MHPDLRSHGKKLRVEKRFKSQGDEGRRSKSQQEVGRGGEMS